MLLFISTFINLALLLFNITWLSAYMALMAYMSIHDLPAPSEEEMRELRREAVRRLFFKK